LYSQLQDLKENEISKVTLDEDRQGAKRYKIISPLHKIEPHVADYGTDYVKIKDLALKEKQVSAIIKWIEDKIKETFISLNNEYKRCDFEYNWLNN
jgi:peptidyl-prolyl cis-trans isomerase SurA